YGRSFDDHKLSDPPVWSEEEPPVWAPVSPDTLASIIFTKGTAVDPRGAMLTHGNFVSDLLSLADVLRAYQTDNFLSILPLNHALEFTGGFLMPYYAGATITYTNTLKTRALIETIEETETSCILAVPRIFRLLYDRLRRIAEVGDRTGSGPEVISRLRLLVSGGAALSADLYQSYKDIGLTVYEGYGLTETAPILTVNPPDNSRPASVGKPLPGIEIRIDKPNSEGCGEIVVQGPNVMAGYYENPDASAEYLRGGWLYTGDIGRIDSENYLYITGRSKDLIVTGAGKNVYPDEVESFYASVPFIQEFRIVGVHSPESMSEDVHAILVPDWEAYTGPRDTDAFRSEVIGKVQSVSRALPSYQRIQHVHIWDGELPEEEDDKKRRFRFRELLGEQLAVRKNGGKHAANPDQQSQDISWEEAVYSVISQLTNRPVAELIVNPDRSLDDLMDSLMRLELLAALETRFETTIPDAAALNVHTVKDVLSTVQQHIDVQNQSVGPINEPVDTSAYWGKVLKPEGWEHTAPEETEAASKSHRTRRGIAQRGFWLVGRLMYHALFGLSCKGLENLPRKQSYIIAANHSSHLDSGAIITAVWKHVDRLNILGAKDYFFDTPLKSWFFRRFMDAVPFDRHGNVVSGLQVSSQVLSPTAPILIYPEGTRSVNGDLQPFKVGLGLLAFELNVPIIPVFIHGTYDILPKGKSLPRFGKIEVSFGAPVEMGPFKAKKGTRMNYALYRDVIEQVRSSIEELRDQRVN
ncbi:MAG: AMP-binding protein, partial [Candidatus Latescibacteria bacterium]|nr:AMP-binding protein [Candidatus Latescibacterota bacterium]